MDAPDSIWTKLTRVIVCLLFLAGLLAVTVWYLPLIKQNERMRKEIMRKDAHIEQEKETSKRLVGSIEALKHDPKAVERLARETLGYAKPGETVIRFEEPVTNSAVTAR
jgi:cell division protein FtsB